MKIVVTGGTGFVGRHLSRQLASQGHQVVVIARGADTRDKTIRKMSGVDFIQAEISKQSDLINAFAGCDAIAHFAGINRQIGEQTYKRVHVDGTRNVVEAARQSGARKIVLLSFLRARPKCGSAYHESKWEAEEIVRNSGLDYTIVKAGMIYGKGDHMLDHLSHLLYTFPLFATVGYREKPIRPLAINDLLRVLESVLMENRLSRKTIAITGPEEILLSEAAKRVARVIHQKVAVFPAPVRFHYLLAWIFERTMKIPLASIAQIRILSEGVTAPAESCDPVPDDLKPRLHFTEEQISGGLPEPEPFGLRDLRCSRLLNGTYDAVR